MSEPPSFRPPRGYGFHARVHWWLNTADLRWGEKPVLGRLVRWAFSEWQRVM
jgi:hypothetical protein